MRVKSRPNIMKDLTVKEAMRRLIINLTAGARFHPWTRPSVMPSSTR